MSAYALCNQVVTLYHREGDRVYRRVLRGAFLEGGSAWRAGREGVARSEDFLFLAPVLCGGYCYCGPAAFGGLAESGRYFTVAAGDRLLPGDGPVVADERGFAALLPGVYDGLCVVGRVAERRGPDGALCHVEARGQ